MGRRASGGGAGGGPSFHERECDGGGYGYGDGDEAEEMIGFFDLAAATAAACDPARGGLPKDATTVARLRRCLGRNFLFSHLNEEQVGGSLFTYAFHYTY